MNVLNRILGTPLPADPLERALVLHAAGAATRDDVHAELRSAQIYVLLEDDTRGGDLHPLAVSTPEGYSVVCGFTTPERAVEMQRQRPEYRAAMAVDPSWVFATLPPEHGFVLNPGHTACLFLAPSAVEPLREEFRQAA